MNLELGINLCSSNIRIPIGYWVLGHLLETQRYILIVFGLGIGTPTCQYHSLTAKKYLGPIAKSLMKDSNAKTIVKKILPLYKREFMYGDLLNGKRVNIE